MSYYQMYWAFLDLRDHRFSHILTGLFLFWKQIVPFQWSWLLISFLILLILIPFYEFLFLSNYNSLWPIFGSNASCISFSNVIFLSQSKIYRSASIILANSSAFSSLIRSISTSNLTESFSSSFNFSTNSLSILKFSFFNFVSEC